jgi:O-methyltransferase involved in polyketide biosynthesis
MSTARLYERSRAGAQVALLGVPETMLWTLYNRASEALRPESLLTDPEAIRIFEAIDYDFERSFGRPDQSHAMRSRMFDRVVRPWILAHPGGTVVELASGLETQFQRCDDGDVNWVCVDVPEAIAVRRRFLREGPRCRYVAKSALDVSWMSGIDASRGLFVTAQGLLMYLQESEVRALLRAILERFPGVELMFDAIPRWFSKKTLDGFYKTPHYRAPAMPWGIDRDELEPTLRSWSPRFREISVAPFGAERGLSGALLQLCARLPFLRNLPPSIVHARSAAGRSS